MLAMVRNDRHDGWDVHLQHVELAYNNFVSAATRLAPNEVHMNHAPCLLLSVFEHHYARYHLEYWDLAADRKRRANALFREQHALTVSRVECRNSALSNAFKQLPTYTVGGWVWVYNTVATIRLGAEAGTDATVFKEKLSLH